MNRALSLILLLTPMAAWPAWEMVGKADGTTYIDVATIHKDGNLRRVWVLEDLEAGKFEELSRRFLVEYDCNAERYRIRVSTTFSGNMGKGSTLMDDDRTGRWFFTPPDTVEYRVLKIVCAK